MQKQQIDVFHKDLDKLSRQEENWVLMTTLQIPWHHAEEIKTKADRKFLLERSKEINEFLKAQQELQQQVNAQEEDNPEAPKIITPNNPFNPA